MQRIPQWINKALKDGRIVYAVEPDGDRFRAGPRIRITKLESRKGVMYGRTIGGDWVVLPEGTLFDGAISNGKA